MPKMDHNLAALMRKSTSKNPSKDISSTHIKSTWNDSSDKQPSIFDISADDRQRILKLIEDLLDAQEEVDKLKAKLCEQKTEFKEKRSILIKKLDRISEKHERAVTENQILTEKYCNNLKQLEDKISTVSNKLESSVEEIKELRKTNEELLKENSALRMLNKETVTLVASLQEKSRCNQKTQFDTQKPKMKSQRTQPKKAVSEAQTNTEEKIESQLSCESHPKQTQNELSYEVGLFHETTDVVDKHSGAGDFITDKNSISPSLETIKAPPVVNYNKRRHPALNLTCNSKCDIKNKSSTYQEQINSSFRFGNDFEDNALLESLFFRF